MTRTAVIMAILDVLLAIALITTTALPYDTQGYAGYQWHLAGWTLVIETAGNTGAALCAPDQSAPIYIGDTGC